MATRTKAKKERKTSVLLSDEERGIIEANPEQVTRMMLSGHESRIEKIRLAIVEARGILTDVTTLERVDVVNGMLDAVALARLQGDTGNMIRGWSEVAKLLGHYAPEKRHLILTDNEKQVSYKMQQLSDAELLRIQSHRDNVQQAQVVEQE